MGYRQDNPIRDKLVERGNSIFKAPKQPIPFTKITPADKLLNDIENYPHAFVLACIMDQQIKAERAWLIPYKISLQLEGFALSLLRPLTETDINKLMRKPENLHRFVDKMSKYFSSAIRRIDEEYGGDASQIWNSNPSSAEVVYRFLQFDGVGPKIACMATNILAREMKVPMDDYFSIDISADIHVRRVFFRLGLCPSDSSVEQVIYKARSLYPKFPGIMDLPSWEIGRNWCKPHQPNCNECYMSDICPSADSE